MKNNTYKTQAAQRSKFGYPQETSESEAGGGWQISEAPPDVVPPVVAVEMQTARSRPMNNGSSARQNPGMTRNVSRRTASGLNVPAAVAIANMVITHVLSNEGDVDWELDQGRGMKHVRGDPNNAGGGPVQERTVRVDGPVMAKDLVLYDDRIYFHCEVNFQYDGRSVGNVTITPVENSDAPAMGLHVVARLMDDDRTYTRPPDTTTVAALKIQFVYQFTQTVYDDSIYIIDMIIFGNGDYTLQRHW